MLLDESNGWGRLRVVSRYFEGTDRTIVVASFFGTNGDVATFTCDSLTEECVAALPWGAAVTRTLPGGNFRVEIYGAGGLLWTGTADAQGNPNSDTSQLVSALSLLGTQNHQTLEAFRNFGVAQGHLAPSPGGFTVSATRISPYCVLAIAQLAYSYVGIFTCLTPVSCLAAVLLGHAGAVIGIAGSC
ncbi:MAG: hypothetical protein ACP5NF_07115 [Thermoanaerobaculum sp.]